MKICAFSVAAIGVVATDPIGANSTSFPACDFHACEARAGAHLSGYPATCYASKACGEMDCSHEYHINDASSYCQYAPKDRYNQCEKACDSAASGHPDWVNDCRYGCGYWQSDTDCLASGTAGDWIAHEVIEGEVTYTLKHGTAKKHAESKTKSWSESVTTTVESGFKFASLSVSSQIGHEHSQTYSDEWSSNTEVTYSVKFPNSDAGKQLWQYVVNIEDSCSHSELTKTRDYALTEGRWQKPCCPAGYGGKGHTVDYQYCHSPAKKASWCATTAEYFTAV